MEVRFWLPTEYGIFWKTHGIPRNSTVFFAVKFTGIPYVFAYGIPHVTKWSRFQIPPLKKNKKSWTNCTVFQFSMPKTYHVTLVCTFWTKKITKNTVGSRGWVSSFVRKPLNVSFWRYTEFHTWKKSRNSVKFRGISQNYTQGIRRNSAGIAANSARNTE